MPFYKFKKNDVYFNTLKTYPEVKFFIYNQVSYYNDTPHISGSFTGSLRATSPGHVSLFELNIDRLAGSNGYISEFKDPDGTTVSLKSVKNTGLIYQFMVKDATRLAFSSVTSTAFGGAEIGEVFTGSYPYTATITKKYYPAALDRSEAPSITRIAGGIGRQVSDSGSVTQLRALKNTINHYNYVNPHFLYSSSYIGGPTDAPGVLNRDFDNIDVGLIDIPSIFYGSKIKPGTIKLDFLISGSLHGRLRDINQDGVLYQTAPAGSPGSGTVAGIALYNEGFIILTGSWDLSDGTHTEDYVTKGVNVAPSWIYFAQSISSSVGLADNTWITTPSSSFLLEMSGTTKIQNLTMFANAPKGALNQSGNPTFTNYVTGAIGVTSSMAYIQNREIGIKNIVSSSYNTPSASFERTTYISKVGIYDKNMNLIAIAKPATPIKKTAERDYTFKIELDI